MVKHIIKSSLKELFAHRTLTVLAGVTLLLAIAFIIYIAVTVHPSEVPLVTHYTAFGVAHLYRDQWFYLFAFGGFALIAAIAHIALTIKMYDLKGYHMALLVAWTGIGVLIFTWVIAASIINVWSPV
ncbi:hypothetical protein KI440_03690 [Candidatus Saccharibacteria bacterium TM7i]|nr:hypothetical protein KI440_03690 [Candidatus Saccharibacteria bacterium TM7i]